MDDKRAEVVLLCMITCALDSVYFNRKSAACIGSCLHSIGLQFLRFLTAHSRWYVPSS
jgi:hypothetical protein